MVEGCKKCLPNAVFTGEFGANMKAGLVNNSHGTIIYGYEELGYVRFLSPVFQYV
ncbi:MAG TPA: hypothetical protein DDW81_06185 [Cryomorphaceae bacterium]|nr:hypothetical protein [Cryomorphaceae bacterium]